MGTWTKREFRTGKSSPHPPTDMNLFPPWLPPPNNNNNKTVMASLPAHPKDMSFGLIGVLNMRVQGAISRHFQAEPIDPAQIYSNASPDWGCVEHFAAAHCATVPSKTVPLDKGSVLGILGEEQIWMRFSSGNSRKSDSQLQYPHWVLRLRPPHSVLPQELLGKELFFQQQSRSYLRAETELYFFLSPQFKPLDIPAKA